MAMSKRPDKNPEPTNPVSEALGEIVDLLWKREVNAPQSVLPATSHNRLAPPKKKGQDADASPRNRIERLKDRENKEIQKQAWQKVFSTLLDRLPTDYTAAYPQLLELRSIFHHELASCMQARLNEHLTKLELDSYQQKQGIATWVNQQLREVGLAIRDPKTGRPATLVADTRDANDELGRFRFDVRDDDGRTRRTFTSNTLPLLELMEDEVRREAFAKQQRSR